MRADQDSLGIEGGEGEVEINHPALIAAFGIVGEVDPGVFLPASRRHDGRNGRGRTEGRIENRS
jgi:hypothetical protein